jgi:glycerophosphoryl diester phosphodiesterase
MKKALVLAINFLCLTMAQAQERSIDWQGHRGCRGLYPENTIQAMLKAIDLGVSTLELDVVITKDKQVILSHEPFMSAEISTNPEGKHITAFQEKTYNIYQLDYAAVQTWDVGLKPHPRFPQQEKTPAKKPLLADVIEAVEAYTRMHNIPPVQYNIETKSDPEGDDSYHPKPAEFVNLLLAVIQTKGIAPRTIIQSFDVRTIQLVHAQYPEIKTAFLVENTSAKKLTTQLKTLGFIPTIFSPAYQFVDQKLVNSCHRKGMHVIVWTVNTLPEMQKMLDLGVDGIISDYPNLFSAIKLAN